jgi:hypothetical protein
MGNESRFVIPEECREFGEANCDERRRVAKRFVEKFVENIAPPKSHDTDGAWTQSERTRFIDICPEGCLAWPADERTRKGEYLVDFGWEKDTGGKRVLFACESEWGSVTVWKTHWRPVEHDFEKLLAVKAPFKVLVFSSDCKRGGCDGDPDTDFSIGYAKQRLEASLRRYGHNIPGETYIFLDFPRTGLKGANGVYRAFMWPAKKYGDTNVSLDDLAEGELMRPPEI